MSKKQKAIDSILKQRMLPLFFNEDAAITVNVVRTLYGAGIRIIEYTNRGEAALQNFKILKKAQIAEMPQMQLGIGTIKSVKEAEEFIDADADFIVSPIVNTHVAEVSKKNDLLWIPGCMTPSEIYLAQQHDAAIIKIFPANIVGPQFISSIKDIFRGQMFMPTGGVELDQVNIDSWFEAGACAVGMGSKLIAGDMLKDEEYEKLFTETQRAIGLVQNRAKR